MDMFRTVARLCVRDVENVVIKRNEEIKKIVKYYLKDMNNANRQTVIDIIVTVIKQEFVIANSVIDKKVQEVYDALTEKINGKKMIVDGIDIIIILKKLNPSLPYILFTGNIFNIDNNQFAIIKLSSLSPQNTFFN